MACNKDITLVDIIFVVDFVNRNVRIFYGDTLLGDTNIDKPFYMNIIKLPK